MEPIPAFTYEQFEAKSSIISSLGGPWMDYSSGGTSAQASSGDPITVTLAENHTTTEMGLIANISLTDPIFTGALSMNVFYSLEIMARVDSGPVPDMLYDLFSGPDVGGLKHTTNIPWGNIWTPVNNTALVGTISAYTIFKLRGQNSFLDTQFTLLFRDIQLTFSDFRYASTSVNASSSSSGRSTASSPASASSRSSATSIGSSSTRTSSIHSSLTSLTSTDAFGQETVVISTILSPSTASSLPPSTVATSISAGQRTAIIAGSVIGAAVFSILLGLLFLYFSRQSRRSKIEETFASSSQQGIVPGAAATSDTHGRDQFVLGSAAGHGSATLESELEESGETEGMREPYPHSLAARPHGTDLDPIRLPPAYFDIPADDRRHSNASEESSLV